MGRSRAYLRIIGMVMLVCRASLTCAAVECTTITQLFSACSTFITYGSPKPTHGSPCCDAMSGLNIIANSNDNRQSVCKCLMGLLFTYNPNPIAMDTLIASCAVSLGFTLDPNTDCNL